ncbi:tetratricopeptide repeat protein [Granulicella aggregans]|uniref:tetratricopeptide repeat protein n=1 Tax=Granulicella aggregans TaxID=474949 RepID=UPI0021DFCD48|nr:tetratricopeptide repeat protein [Granulicella aggregans]
MTFRFPRLATATLALGLLATPAFAVNKDMVQLQTQVQALEDAVARLQQSNDERMGVMKDLVQQTADSVNKMSVVVQGLQTQMGQQHEAQNTKMEQVSGQIQSLNDSLDELKARLAGIEKSINNIQNQQQSINANIQSGAPATGSSIPQQTAPPTQDNPAPLGDAPPAPVVRKPSAAVPQADNGGGSAPPVGDLYKTALGDYMGARYALATAEFGDVIKFYPDDNLSGNSFYYLGEIEYRGGKYAAAVKNYDNLASQFPASPKLPAARLHKGEALIAMKQNDAGIAELRAVIQRYPTSPEAAQARSRLSGLGVRTAPRR